MKISERRSRGKRTSSIGHDAWKVDLIVGQNPNWDDLFERIA